MAFLNELNEAFDVFERFFLHLFASDTGKSAHMLAHATAIIAAEPLFECLVHLLGLGKGLLPEGIF